jgi:glycosyltransferase involved in cell wall biosynthesis
MSQTRSPEFGHKERPFLSIVVPFFNEEESVVPLYRKIREACTQLAATTEMIFVDDGSTDRTFVALEALHDRDPAVRVVRFRRNYGQSAAMAAGFRAARGRIVISMDGDLQNDPADIPRLLAKLDEGYDVVCGWRRDRKDKLASRRIPSIVANWLIGKLTGVVIRDSGCALKAYRHHVIKRMALYAELHRFIPALSTLAGSRIAELVVRHHPRRFGRSKYGISRVWRVVLDLFLIKMLIGFSSQPLLWFGLLSVPVLALGMLFLLLTAWAGHPSGVVLPTLTFLCLALAGHLQMVGVLAEMVLYTGDFRTDRMIMWLAQRAPNSIKSCLSIAGGPDDSLDNSG